MAALPTFGGASNYTHPQCQLPPPGWWCTRRAGHDGPCAALPNDDPPNPDYDQGLDFLNVGWLILCGLVFVILTYLLRW
jgi:hypothetical protein